MRGFEDRRPGAGRGKAAARRRYRPGVEAMESRQLLHAAPASPVAELAAEVAPTAVAEATPHRVYLDYLAEALHAHDLDPAYEAQLVSRLGAGASRSRVAAELLRSPEVATGMIRSHYLSFLDREPTAAETRRMLGLVRAGGDARTVFLAIATGREYARIHGGTAAGFVRALYEDAVRRPATEVEVRSWLRRLRAGATTAEVARGIVFSPESLARKARGLLRGTADAGSPTAERRAARILAAPGGLDRLRAEYLGAADVFARVTLVDRTSPPATDAPAAPRPPGLRIAPVLNLGTNWAPIDTSGGPALDGTNLVAAGADGSVWVTGPNGQRDQLYVLPAAGYTGGDPADRPGWRALPKLPFQILWPSAVTEDLIYAVANGALYRIDGAGNATAVATPPEVAGRLTQVAAALDGTLMAMAPDAVVLQLPGEAGLTIVPPPPPVFREHVVPLVPFAIAAGSKDSIYSVYKYFEMPFHFEYSGGQWTRIQQDLGVDPRWYSATSDGALWAWGFHHAAVRSPITGQWQVVDTTIVRDAGGVVTTTPVDAPEAIGVGAAISQDRLVVSLSPNAAGANTVQVLSLGIADRAAVPTLPTDPLDLSFYNAISTYLGTTGPGGIRGVYDTTSSANLAEYFSKLSGMPAPSNVTPANRAQWVALQTQILDELQYAPAVINLFTTISTINADIRINNGNNLQGIVPLIGAGQDIPGDSAVALYIFDAIEAAIAGIVSALSGPTAVIGSILASAFGSAVSLATGDASPDSNTALDIQYHQLTDTLRAFYKSVDDINSAYETAILTDWGRLSALGPLLLGPDPVWAPPTGSESEVANKTEDPFIRFFYRSLMPAKWQLVDIPKYTYSWDAMCYICAPAYAPYPPSYAMVAQKLGVVPGTHGECSIMSFQFMNELGASPDPFSDRDGPYPTQALMQALYTAFGITKESLLSGGGDLGLKVVNGPSGP
jgi:hypothetical protein